MTGCPCNDFGIPTIELAINDSTLSPHEGGKVCVHCGFYWDRKI